MFLGTPIRASKLISMINYYQVVSLILTKCPVFVTLCQI